MSAEFLAVGDFLQADQSSHSPLPCVLPCTEDTFKGLLAIFNKSVFFFPKKTLFSNPKISANTHAISKIPKDSETSAKILVTFFFFFDFGQRNCMNQLLEVFDFLDLRPEIFILNWYLPLIPLSFTDLVGVF